MYRILLVDDEQIFRIAFKSLVDWESLGFKVHAEAQNGRDAIDIFKDEPCEVVVTDIKMPVMDGIELIRTLKDLSEEGRRATYIVLTAYDDFHLVKTAFKSGVVDYILKPEMSTETLTQLFSNIKTTGLSLFSEDKREHDRNTAEHLGLREGVLEKIIKGGHTPLSDVTVDNEVFDLINHALYFAVCKLVIESGNIKKKITTNLGSVYKNIEDIIQKSTEGVLFTTSPREHLVILSFNDILSKNRKNEVLWTICSEIRQYISQYFNLRVSFGISSIKSAKTCSALAELIAEAEAAEEYKFLCGKGNIIRHDEIKNFSKTIDESWMVDKINVLRRYLEADIKDDSISDLLRLSSKKYAKSEFNKIRFLFTQYAAILYEHSYKNADAHKEASNKVQDYYDYYQKDGSLDELYMWFQDVICFFESTINDEDHLIRRAKNYIHSNLASALTLESIAMHLNISEGHFCRIFSQNTGQSCVKFINQIRIEKAVWYLLNTDMKNYEISEKVGYSNQEYYFRVFKNETGMTPKEYVKKHR